MFMLNEIRKQLKKYPTDPECSSLLKELEEHYGYDTALPSSPEEALQHFMDDAQDILKKKGAVEKQIALIEFNKKMKYFRLNTQLSADQRHRAEELMIGVANMVLGTNIISFATE